MRWILFCLSIGHFISSNPAGNAQHNGFAFQVHDNTSLYLAGLLAARIVLLLSISCRGAKVKGIQQLANGLRTAIINCNFTFCAFYTFITGQLCIILRQYRTILSADTASEARQLLSQKRR